MGKVIAFIPVRGGSKSIPLKNIRNFCGKPLVYWNAQALQEVMFIDEIIVATDSDLIEETVKKFGFNKLSVYRRLQENAEDTSSTESVILEYINARKDTLSNDDIFMLVQATSPLTQSQHFEEALKQYNESDFDSMLSCVRFKRFFWTIDGVAKNYDFKNRPRRQDFEGDLLENGAFYINTVGNILSSKNRLSGKIGIYEMPEYTSVEIDEEEDWFNAEKQMKKHILSKKQLRFPIKLFLTDVDGVLTDAGMYYTEEGDELKKFNTHDGMAFQLLREAGIKTGIITSENTKMVERRAAKLKVDYLFQGKREGGKLSAAIEICELEKISLQEVAYIGDDINCINLLSAVGMPACPSNAVAKIKSLPNIIHLNTAGGDGAVREFVEKIIQESFYE